MRTAAAATGAGPYDQLEKKQLQVIVEQLQASILKYMRDSGTRNFTILTPNFRGSLTLETVF